MAFSSMATPGFGMDADAVLFASVGDPKFDNNPNAKVRPEQGLLAMMEHRSFEEISVSDLCERMGIPRKSFYRYFSSKDGALMALLDHTF